MQNGVQVKAVIPRELRRQVFTILAAREETFSHWLRTQIAALLRQVDATAIKGLPVEGDNVGALPPRSLKRERAQCLGRQAAHCAPVIPS